MRIRETPMTDDLRGHDPRPTDEERAWIDTDIFAATRRIAILLILAFAVAGYLGYAMDSDKPNLVASRHGG
jgi:hypothetical protein